MVQTQTKQQVNTGDTITELVTFVLDGALYGIDILTVQEINKLTDWTPVPHSDDFVLGILSLRGSIVTVIDLREKLGIGRAAITANSRNVIVNWNDQGVGLFVDGIGDVTPIDWEEVCAPPANVNGIQGRFFKGVLKTGTNLIAILNVDEVLQEIDLET